MRQIPPLEVLAGQLRTPADTLGDIASGHLQMHAARMHAFSGGDLDEAPDLGHDVAHHPCLQPVDGARIAVHRVDAPDRVAALAPGRAHQLGQMRSNVRRTEAADQHQPARRIVGIETLHQAQEIVDGKAGTALQTDGIADAAGELDMRAVDLARAVADPDHVA